MTQVTVKLKTVSEVFSRSLWCTVYFFTDSFHLDLSGYAFSDFTDDTGIILSSVLMRKPKRENSHLIGNKASAKHQMVLIPLNHAF